MKRHLLLLCLALALGCGDDGTPDSDRVEQEVLTPATLSFLSPSTIVLGDPVSLGGQQFEVPNHAVLEVAFTGTFTDEDGEIYDINDLRLPVRVESEARGQFAFDDVRFHPNGDKLGVFEGTAALVKHHALHDADDDVRSEDLDVRIEFAPSLLVETLRAVGESCPKRTRGTLEDREFEISVRALGVGEAASNDPWRVNWNFNSPNVRLYYVMDDILDSNPGFAREEGFRLDRAGAYVSQKVIGFFRKGELDATQVREAQRETTNHLNMHVYGGDTITLSPRKRIQSVTAHPPVRISDSQQQSEGLLLYGIKTGRLSQDTLLPAKTTDRVVATVSVETPHGTLRRAIAFNYRTPLEIDKAAGKPRLTKRTEPKRMSNDRAAFGGCYAGGLHGAKFDYRLDSSVRRERSVSGSYHRGTQDSTGGHAGIFPSQGAWGAIGTLLGPLTGQVDVSETLSRTFDLNTSQSESRDQTASQSFGLEVLPNMYATIYVQKETWEHTADIWENAACGQRVRAGTLILSDVLFSVDTPQGKKCAPASELPTACEGRDCPQDGYRYRRDHER